MMLNGVPRAMSLVPARISTARGCRSITSALKRPSIWLVTWPVMPRLRKSRPVKYSFKCQKSVMESPRKTTRGAAAGRQNAGVGVGVTLQVIAIRIAGLEFLIGDQRGQMRLPGDRKLSRVR